MDGDAQSAEAHFRFVDQQLFDRLFSGPIQPLSVTLSDGSKIAGWVRGIVRGANDDGEEVRWGRILISCALSGSEVEISYQNIVAIV